VASSFKLTSEHSKKQPLFAIANLTEEEEVKDLGKHRRSKLAEGGDNVSLTFSEDFKAKE